MCVMYACREVDTKARQKRSGCGGMRRYDGGRQEESRKGKGKRRAGSAEEKVDAAGERSGYDGAGSEEQDCGRSPGALLPA